MIKTQYLKSKKFNQINYKIIAMAPNFINQSQSKNSEFQNENSSNYLMKIRRILNLEYQVSNFKKQIKEITTVQQSMCHDNFYCKYFSHLNCFKKKLLNVVLLNNNYYFLKKNYHLSHFNTIDKNFTKICKLYEIKSLKHLKKYIGYNFLKSNQCLLRNSQNLIKIISLNSFDN